MIEEETLNAAPAVSNPSRLRRIWRYGPLILWAALIFLFSSASFSGSRTSSIFRPLLVWLYPSLSDAGLALFNALVRKGAHFAEYAILALFAARAFRTSSRDFLRNHWFVVSFVFVTLYALSDEFHQSFVPSRTASIYDCLIDTAGGLAALLVVAMRNRKSSRSGSRPPLR